MENCDWLVNAAGERQPFRYPVADPPDIPYRLYRFLSEVEDIIIAERDDRRRLEAICPRVRRLLDSSPWLQAYHLQPPRDRGWSVLKLYEEPDFKLTVQMVAWLPGRTSPIHNHGAWGIVALIDGEEKNRLWRRSDPKGDRIELVEECVLEPGEIIGFEPDAIHNVEALGDEPTVSFNLYGITDYKARFEFDPEKQTAKRF